MREMHERIRRAKGPTQMLDVCGGAILYLTVDGRSKAGKLLASYSHPEFRIDKGPEGFNVHIAYDFKVVPPANAQDMYLWVAAENAALEVIRNRTGLDGYVRTYVD
jgi:hypothetical protein